MADPSSTPRDPSWYENQWEELMDVLPTSNPEEVVDQVRELQISVLDEEAEALEEMGIADAENAKTVLQRIFTRLQKLRQENQVLQDLQKALNVDSPNDIADAIVQLRDRLQTLEERQQVLAEAGFDRPEHAIQALASMKEQLDELYGEKEATERSIPDSDFEVNGDTFDQLQGLMAREEKLQRELGVSSPQAVIEIVEGLTDQLEDLYQDRDASTNSIFEPATESTSSDSSLEEVLGTSDSDAIIEMISSLTDQLDALYESRERLAELNLNGADEAIEMVRSMRYQLDALYKQQDEMSDHGIDGIDHALSMIDSMEAQLSALYDERERLAEEESEIPEEVLFRLGALEEKLNDLIEQKEALRDKRDRLQTQFDQLEAQIVEGDPDTVTALIDDLEDQLEAISERTKGVAQRSPFLSEKPLLPEETFTQLDDLDDNELNDLPAGVFGVDDQGTIRRTNENVLQWPDVETDDPEALLGKNVFDDVAPAAKNVLFQGRFQNGVDAGEMDEQFFYTYVSQRDPSSNLMVRLYRDPEEAINWIVFRVL